MLPLDTAFNAPLENHDYDFKRISYLAVHFCENCANYHILRCNYHLKKGPTSKDVRGLQHGIAKKLI